MFSSHTHPAYSMYIFLCNFCRSTNQQQGTRRRQQSERLQNGRERERSRRPKSDGIQHADSSIMEDDVSCWFGGTVMIVSLDQRHSGLYILNMLRKRANVLVRCCPFAVYTISLCIRFVVFVAPFGYMYMCTSFLYRSSPCCVNIYVI